jgi:hypothetical protein
MQPEMTPRAPAPEVSAVLAAAKLRLQSMPQDAMSLAADSDSECDELVAQLQPNGLMARDDAIAPRPRDARSASPTPADRLRRADQVTRAAQERLRKTALPLPEEHGTVARRPQPKPKPARASASAEFDGHSGRAPRDKAGSLGPAHFHISVPKRPASVLGHVPDAKPARGGADAKLPAEIPEDLCAVEDFRRVPAPPLAPACCCRAAAGQMSAAPHHIRIESAGAS